MDDIVPSTSICCRACQQVKPASDFYSYEKHFCKSCMSVKARDRMQRIKAKNQTTVQPTFLNVEQTIQCRICGEEKSPDKFKKDVTRLSGYTTVCKQCHNKSEAGKKTDPLTSGKYRESRKKYRVTHENTHTFRYRLKTKYDLTPDQYNAMLAGQNGMCAACGKAETARRRRDTNKVRRLSVDHDHKTGEIRGLLCSACNIALGLLEDNPDRILGLLDYLEKH